MTKSYLEDTPCANWSYQHFKEYKQQTQRHRPVRRKALQNEFRRMLQNFRQRKGLSGVIKKHIDELLANTDESSSEDAENTGAGTPAAEPISSIHISGQGTSLIHYGDVNITNNESSTNSRSENNNNSSGMAREVEGTSQNDTNIDVLYTAPGPANHYLLENGFDVSDAFYRFQCSILPEAAIYMESNVHHILALSSILLVKPGRMHEDVNKIFGYENAQMLEQHFKRDLRLAAYGDDFDMNHIQFVSDIIKKIGTEQESRLGGQCKVLNRALEVEHPDDQKILASIANLIAVLPNQEIMDELSEQELCTRYLHATLSPLFDDPSQNFFFRWTSTVDSSTHITSKKNHQGRPDVILSWLRGVHFAKNVGFAEVKRIEERGNSYSICNDLVRLSKFSKAAIENGEAKTCLAIQSVGRTSTFYMTKRVAGYFYVMIEIGTVTTPSSLENLAPYLMELGTIKNVLRIFKTCCVVGDGEVHKIRSTDRTIPRGRKRSRPSVTRHRYAS